MKYYSLISTLAIANCSDEISHNESPIRDCCPVQYPDYDITLTFTAFDTTMLQKTPPANRWRRFIIKYPTKYIPVDCFDATTAKEQLPFLKAGKPLVLLDFQHLRKFPPNGIPATI